MATNIYFGAGATEGTLSIRVEDDYVTVARTLRENEWVEFTRSSGHRPVLVNARNVLWIQETGGRQAAG